MNSKKRAPDATILDLTSLNWVVAGDPNAEPALISKNRLRTRKVNPQMKGTVKKLIAYFQEDSITGEKDK